MFCTHSEVFDVLLDADTQGRAGTLYAVGNGNEAYVVMGTEDGKRILVQTVTDQSGSRRGNQAIVDVPGIMKLTGAQLSGRYAARHRLRRLRRHRRLGLDRSLLYGGAAVGAAGHTRQGGLGPRSWHLLASPARLLRLRLLGARHAALSCQEAADGGSTGRMDLFVDDVLVGSNSTPDGSYEVNHFLLSNGQYVLLTGEGPGEARVFHAPVNSPNQFKAPLLVKFKATSPTTTWPITAWESTGGTSLLVVEVDVSGGGLSTPASLWQGAFSNLDDVGNTPPPMTAIQQALKPADLPTFYLYGRPSKVRRRRGRRRIELPSNDSIVFGLFSHTDGKPLLLGQPV